MPLVLMPTERSKRRCLFSYFVRPEQSFEDGPDIITLTPAITYTLRHLFRMEDTQPLSMHELKQISAQLMRGLECTWLKCDLIGYE